MAVSLAISLRTLFCALGSLMLATLIYTISTDGLPFHTDLLTPWMAATLVDFYINVAALGAWIIYKESSWVSSIIWLVLLVCFGSITTCSYIVLQFMKLSPQESLQDPIYFVLLQRKSKDEVEQKMKFSVISARVLFGALGFLMLGTLIYTIITDGSPFRSELLTPWMTATLIDFYINVFALSVWVVYKESSWINSFIWILLLISFSTASQHVHTFSNNFSLSHLKILFTLFCSVAVTGMREHRRAIVIYLPPFTPTLVFGRNESYKQFQAERREAETRLQCELEKVQAELEAYKQAQAQMEQKMQEQLNAMRAEMEIKMQEQLRAMFSSMQSSRDVSSGTGQVLSDSATNFIRPQNIKGHKRY